MIIVNLTIHTYIALRSSFAGAKITFVPTRYICVFAFPYDDDNDDRRKKCSFRWIPASVFHSVMLVQSNNKFPASISAS